MAKENSPQMGTKVLYVSLGVLAATLVVGIAGVSASDASKPGDLLYGVDRSLENVQERMISDPVKKLEFTEALIEERTQELANTKDETQMGELEDEINELEDQADRLEDEVEEETESEAESENEAENEVENETDDGDSNDGGEADEADEADEVEDNN